MKYVIELEKEHINKLEDALGYPVDREDEYEVAEAVKTLIEQV